MEPNPAQPSSSPSPVPPSPSQQNLPSKSSMSTLAIFIVITGVLALGGMLFFIFSSQGSNPSVTSTPTVLPTASSSLPTQAQSVTVQNNAKPDLAIGTIQITYSQENNKFDCKQLGRLVTIKNQGTVAVTKPFTVKVNETAQTFSKTIEPGATTFMWFPDDRYSGETTVSLDSDGVIDEVNETNNQITKRVPIPTQPHECEK